VSDLFVLPSHYEGISIAALEAMSMGIPVIASNVGGNKEIILENKTGFLFEPGDLNQLVKQIQYFLNDRTQLNIFGQNALDRVQQQFYINKMVAEYLKLYSQT
jgi:glycosyltransferase involved in cell wall biosynthesis